MSAKGRHFYFLSLYYFRSDGLFGRPQCRPKADSTEFYMILNQFSN